MQSIHGQGWESSTTLALSLAMELRIDLWDEVRRLMPLLEACEETQACHENEHDPQAAAKDAPDQNGQRS